jgi:hypothetical protein
VELVDVGREVQGPQLDERAGQDDRGRLPRQLRATGKHFGWEAIGHVLAYRKR